MKFNSYLYLLLFLPAVVVVTRLLPPPKRKWCLIACSFVFYGTWDVRYLPLLVALALLNFGGARWIGAATGDRGSRGKWVVATNLIVLIAFKYVGWLGENAISLLRVFGVHSNLQPPAWALPLGLSFYTFENLSYVIDVMRKREQPRSFSDVLLFITFFPKLIAGPIVRMREFQPQIGKTPTLDARTLRDALRYIVIGLFFKVVVADGLAQSVDAAYERDPALLGTVDVYITSLSGALQMYFDFAGYSRIAIGSAKLLGFELTENFDHPFMAKSPPEHWRRWHMSLQRWIRDYVFTPLSRTSPNQTRLQMRLRVMWAVIVSMTLFGLWHGAGWNWVAWGTYSGVVVVVYHLVFPRSSEARPPVASWRRTVVAVGGWFLTHQLLSLGTVFRRAHSLPQAITLLKRALTPWSSPPSVLPMSFRVHVMELLVICALVGVVVNRRAIAPHTVAAGFFRSRIIPYAASLGEGVALGLMCVITYVRATGVTAFIYFQF